MSIPERSSKILVIDDEEQIRRALKSILSARHYEVLLAGGGLRGSILQSTTAQSCDSGSDYA